MDKLYFTDQAKNELRSLGIVSLYLFGSRAEGLATTNSDYDFAVLLKDSTSVKPGKNTHDLYQKIYEIFLEICGSEKIIDIIFLQSGVSLELQANVVKFGRVFLDDDPQMRANYEAQVMLRMADLKPILDEMDRTILDRV